MPGTYYALLQAHGSEGAKQKLRRVKLQEADAEFFLDRRATQPCRGRHAVGGDKGRAGGAPGSANLVCSLGVALLIVGTRNSSVQKPGVRRDVQQRSLWEN